MNYQQLLQRVKANWRRSQVQGKDIRQDDCTQVDVERLRDLLIWFGGLFMEVSRAHLSVVPYLSKCYGVIGNYSDQSSFKSSFSLPREPWEKYCSVRTSSSSVSCTDFHCTLVIRQGYLKRLGHKGGAYHGMASSYIIRASNTFQGKYNSYCFEAASTVLYCISRVHKNGRFGW
jgi:hypothetical protein